MKFLIITHNGKPCLCIDDGELESGQRDIQTVAEFFDGSNFAFADRIATILTRHYTEEDEDTKP